MARMTGFPRWRDLSQVQRADLYLRSSLYLLLWLIPLATFVPLLALGDPVELGAALVVVLLACGAGTPVLRDVIALHPDRGPLPWRGLAGLGAVVVLAVVVTWLIGPAVGGPMILVSSTAVLVAVGGLTDQRVVAGIVALLVLVPLVAGAAAWQAAVVLLAYGGFLSFTVRSSLWLFGVIAELDRARSAQSALAVAEERLRFSRDVHDVLGRHLSTIAVQAELGATLSRRGDERAAEVMLEVRGGAHDALREARELARGYRETDLDTELEGARSLLASAGIGFDVSVDGLPETWREPAAWVVREAVTNVLRHSTARHVAVRWEADRLSVTDDGGTAARTGGGDGSGLRGLGERLGPLGAEVVAGPDEDGFTVTMSTRSAMSTRSTRAEGPR